MTHVTLHRPEDIFSFRHVPTWLMLTFAAGCVNAIAVVACDRFVTHVTGTVTRLGMEVARFAILLDFAIVLASFIVGAITSSVLINGGAHRGKRPLHARALVIVAAATASIALAGHVGLAKEGEVLGVDPRSGQLRSDLRAGMSSKDTIGFIRPEKLARNDDQVALPVSLRRWVRVSAASLFLRSSISVHNA